MVVAPLDDFPKDGIIDVGDGNGVLLGDGRITQVVEHVLDEHGALGDHPVWWQTGGLATSFNFFLAPSPCAAQREDVIANLRARARLARGRARLFRLTNFLDYSVIASEPGGLGSGGLGVGHFVCGVGGVLGEREKEREGLCV